jgi:anti-sigma regulatory factor (Ser/Thr protein kinase)
VAISFPAYAWSSAMSTRRADGNGTGGAGGGGAAGHFHNGGLEQPFSRESLVALRSAVAAHGGQLGLDPRRVDDLVLVAHELATNAVRHGGGAGQLRVWRAAASVFCEVADSGSGFSYPGSGVVPRPTLGATGGRGLWIVAHLVDDLRVKSDADGTVALVEIRLR